MGDARSLTRSVPRSRRRRDRTRRRRSGVPRPPHRPQPLDLAQEFGDAVRRDLEGEGGAAGLMNGYRLSVHAGPTAPPSPLPPQANGEIGNDHHEDNPEAHAS